MNKCYGLSTSGGMSATAISPLGGMYPAVLKGA